MCIRDSAPSIKRADIGVGMGITGTDVTKNVADMVLADDNFATIINAVEEGRRIYDNIRKVIQFLLSANIAEVLSVFVATLIGFTIFQPVQLLWINLITDSCLLYTSPLPRLWITNLRRTRRKSFSSRMSRNIFIIFWTGWSLSLIHISRASSTFSWESK